MVQQSSPLESSEAGHERDKLKLLVEFIAERAERTDNPDMVALGTLTQQLRPLLDNQIRKLDANTLRAFASWLAGSMALCLDADLSVADFDGWLRGQLGDEARRERQAVQRLRRELAGNPAAPEAGARETASVLVIDDDASIRDFLEAALSDAGYRVRTAENGAVAMDAVGGFGPDLILLDMRMPIMDGWAFTHVYRDRPPPHAPIVVMTAALDAAQRAAEVAADGYLAKPFSLEELTDVVQYHVPG
jgi:two-component system, chemotaxis family, chemotaxis protein CheY